MQRTLRSTVRPCALAVLAALTLATVTAHAASAAKTASPKHPASQPADARIDSDLFAGLKARAIGPAAMSGRVTAIEGVESNPGILYVGAAAGGVWKSVNGGLTWKPVFDDQPVASIGAIAVNQANPDIVWVGTGEANVRNSVSVGNGVYRSLDGGRTWKHLGLTQSEHIRRIVLDPRNPDVAYVAALGQLWGEGGERGIYKTADGGRTWKRVLAAGDKTGGGELAIDPANPNKLFAALWQVRRWPWALQSGGPGSGLYVTYDGGESWKRYSEEDGLPKGDLGRIGLAVSRSNPEVVYAIVEADKSALLRSEDGGRSWKKATEEPEIIERAFYYAEIRVDPAWPNRVYDLTSRLRVSADSGKTFDTVARRDIHGDYHAMWIDPKNPDHLVAGNDGGVGISHDRGETWDFVADLPLGQFYHVAVDDDRPYHVYGGLQDNGSWRGPNTLWERGGVRNSDWQSVAGGDGFNTRPDPRDSSRGYAMSQAGNLVRWDLKSGERRDIRPPDPQGGPALRFNWNAGFAQDPLEPGTIYYGSQFLHRSTDGGNSWETISPDLSTNNPDWQKQDVSGGLTVDVSGAENYTTILAIAPSPVTRGVLWVGTDDGRLQVTKDGGKSWTSVEGNLPGVPKNTWIPNVKASTYDAGTAFVVLDNHRRSDWAPYVFRTSDYGKSWQSLATADLRGYTLAIEEDPVDRDLLFLGTEFGLFVSTDGGAHWLPFRHGLPTTSVMALAIQPRESDLVIGTHGRSLYIVDDIGSLRHARAATLAEPLHLFPVGDAQEHYVSSTGNRGGAGQFQGENEPYGALITYSLHLPGLPLPDEAKERQRKEDERARAASAPPTTATTPRGEDLPRAGAAGVAGAAETPEAPEPAQAGAAGRAGESGRGNQGPRVDIVIADAAGKEVRRFKGPARLGVNRAVWDFGSQVYKQPRDRRPSPFRNEDSGPQVAPGIYNVTVRFQGHEAKGTVKVLPDPSLQGLSATTWSERQNALDRARKLHAATTAAVERVIAARRDVDVVLAKVRQAPGDSPDGRPREADKPLVQAGEKLKRDLTAAEKKLWIPPGTKGLLRDKDV
ncbi:MAG TPA: hypothetical protein VGR07_14120, partial [Thermoanaerobaculia bacterium]|nr:hypothetical protein [Thermoanaerobaculia bacterium]